MLWGKQESKAKQDCLQADNYASRCPVQKKAGIGSEEAGDRSNYHAEDQQTREMICQQIGCCARRDHKCYHQKGANRLQCCNTAGRQYGEKDQVQSLRVQANRARMGFIKEHNHQVAPFQHKNKQ